MRIIPTPYLQTPGWAVIQSDCVSFLDVGSIKNYVDLAFADPPYNIGIDYGDHVDDNRTDGEYLNWCCRWISGIADVLKPTGSFWLLVNHEYAADLDVMIRKQIGLHRQQWITWYESFGVNCTRKFNRCSRPLLWYTKSRKGFTANHNDPEVRRPSDRQIKYRDKRSNPNGKLWDDIWGINPPIPRVCGSFKERIEGFPTQLPLKLLRPIVAFSSNPGDIVLDPFSGSATTGVACLEKGRKYIGIELGEEYARLSRKRLRTVSEELSAQVPGLPAMEAI